MAKRVQIDEELYHKLSDRVENSEFDTVETYVTFVLEEVVKEHPEIEGDRSSTSEGREDDVRENLRSLGYLE